jgi:Cu2+-containing amine oxidase
MAPSKKPVKAARSPKLLAKSPPPAKPKPGVVKPGPAAKPAAKPAARPATKPVAPAGRAAKPGSRAADPDVTEMDPSLFDPLTPGEIADALRTLTEDRRLSSMAKVGRYRVICTEPLVVKPPHWMAGHRLVRAVVFDSAADRTVDACIDLDAGVVAQLELTRAQPMLSRDEETLAVSIATSDERVREKLALGDTPQSTLHYWGRAPEDLAYARRSAAVVFGRPDGHASIVCVVDLLENIVTQVVPAEQW